MKKILILGLALFFVSCGGSGGSSSSSSGIGDATFNGNITTFTAALETQKGSTFAQIKDFLFPSAYALDSQIRIKCITCSSSTFSEVDLGGRFSIALDTGDHTINFTSSGSTVQYFLEDIDAGETLEWSQIQIDSSAVSNEHTGTYIGTYIGDDGEIDNDVTMKIAVNGNSMTGTVGGTVLFTGSENGTTFDLTWTKTNSSCTGTASGSFSGNTISARVLKGSDDSCGVDGDFTATKS